MENKAIHIEALHTLEQFKACEQLQQLIWQSEPVEVVPSHLLITFQRHGGLVLGAFDDNQQMIGCLFGFPGQISSDNPAALGSEKWQHCSHLMGIVKEWRGKGVGYQLKLAQRQWALSQGLELITWTYDPLEAGNGTLNLGKLGAICRCYLRDLYGQMAEKLNTGLPSDRFEVAWWLNSKRVQQRLEPTTAGWQPLPLQHLLDQGAVIVNAGRLRPDGGPEPGPLQPMAEKRLLLEIPHDLQALKSANLDLALAWRLNVREACESAFAAGYTCCDVVKAPVDGMSRAYYLLEKIPES